MDEGLALFVWRDAAVDFFIVTDINVEYIVWIKLNVKYINVLSVLCISNIYSSVCYQEYDSYMLLAILW